MNNYMKILLIIISLNIDKRQIISHMKRGRRSIDETDRRKEKCKIINGNLNQVGQKRYLFKKSGFK